MIHKFNEVFNNMAFVAYVFGVIVGVITHWLGLKLIKYLKSL